MIKQRLIFLILILAITSLGLASCTTTEQPTPTPFPGSGTSNPITNLSNEVIPVELVDLAASPEIYEGAYLKINGRYRRTTTHVCSDTSYPSPVTWGLTSGDLLANMNGLGTQLRSLIPDETTMEVNGVWRHWEGPVGCGKAATVQQLYYLEVREIISPNPLTQITLTPTHPADDQPAEGTQIASSGDDSSSDFADETPNPEQQEGETAVPTLIGLEESTPIPTSTPSSGFNPPTATVTAVATESNDDDGSDDDEENSSATVTPTPTNSTSGTVTPVNTETPGDNSGTPAATAPSLSTATPIPEEVEIDELDTSRLDFELITNAEIHVWTLDLLANDVITLSVVSEPDLNITLSLIDPTGQIIIDQQDISPAGSIEILENVPITASGEYKLHVQTTDNSSGEYVISFYDNSDSEPALNYQDVLAYGDSFTATLQAEADDYWYFYGNSGDSITITVLSGSGTDLFVTLWSVTNDIAESDEPTGDPEIITFTLPDNGMYSIQVADWDFLEQDYSINLESN